MQHYAITDGLVAVVALYCCLAIWRSMAPDKGRNFIVACYLTIFAAAATGTVRFGAGLVNELKTSHELLSAFSGSVGMGWLLFATVSIFLSAAKKPFIRLVAWAAFPALFLISTNFVPYIPLLIVTTGGFVIFALVAAGGLALTRQKQKLAGLLIVAALMLSSLAGVRSSSLYGPDFGWHLYHLILAAWLFIVSQAYLENDRSRLAES